MLTNFAQFNPYRRVENIPFSSKDKSHEQSDFADDNNQDQNNSSSEEIANISSSTTDFFSGYEQSKVASLNLDILV